jgi:hypothetical protein
MAECTPTRPAVIVDRYGPPQPCRCGRTSEHRGVTYRHGVGLLGMPVYVNPALAPGTWQVWS